MKPARQDLLQVSNGHPRSAYVQHFLPTTNAGHGMQHIQAAQARPDGGGDRLFSFYDDGFAAAGGATPAAVIPGGRVAERR